MNTGRQDLWAIGTPIILAGQIVLVLGLVLQLDRIWRDVARPRPSWRPSTSNSTT